MDCQIHQAEQHAKRLLRAENADEDPWRPTGCRSSIELLTKLSICALVYSHLPWYCTICFCTGVKVSIAALILA